MARSAPQAGRYSTSYCAAAAAADDVAAAVLAGNSLTGKPKDMALAGKGGLFYKQYGGLCLSAQAFPNAINTPTFPSMVVHPGDMYSNRVSYDFSCAV